MSVQRWYPAVDLGGYGYMEETSEEGDDIFVRFTDHQSSLAEREQRIAELEAALRDMLEGHEDEDPNRPCIANARAALAATEGEKREPT